MQRLALMQKGQNSPEQLLSAKRVVLKSVQKETYRDDISALVEQKNIPRSSVLKKRNTQI